MKKRTIKNPLLYRIFRELCGDWKKYSILGLFLVLTIGFVSGMYIANDSMEKTLSQGRTDYHLEDGHFVVSEPLSQDTIKQIESAAFADIHSYYLDKAKQEFEEKFETEFKKEFDSAFEQSYTEQVLQTILAQGIPSSLADSYVQSFLTNAKQDGSYEQVYQDAYRQSYDEAYEEGWKEVKQEVEEEYQKAVERYELENTSIEEPVKLYENFYRNAEEDSDLNGSKDATIRVYQKTEDINLASVLEGRLPNTENEVAIDRMHANNAHIVVGDTIHIDKESYTVVGLIAYVNYTTLHEKNTDFMFDAIQFNVAMMTPEGYARLSSNEQYAYAWTYEHSPKDQMEEKTFSDSFMKFLLTNTIVADVELNDYIPRYANQAVWFAPDDMGSDKAMGGVLLNVLIGIIAFIFAITISNTMEKESGTIGTLRAMGYTKKELLLHYLSMPVIVIFVSAIVGNLLGYTLFTKMVTSMYYNSYSLPAYHQVFNSEAFLKTTIIPILIMLLVDGILLAVNLQRTPLQFLRKDFTTFKRKKAMRLPKWKFMNRFRLRIIFQNIPHYFILLFGIFFISILLAMAVGMPSTLSHYLNQVDDMVFSKYQYVLKNYEEDGNAITTQTEGAERFNSYSLLYPGKIDEEITVYGMQEDSAYVQIDAIPSLSKEEVYVSDSFAKKYHLTIGDTIQLKEKYDNQEYTFHIVGTYAQSLGLSIFTSMPNFAETFDWKENQFTGYLSNQEITDIDSKNIATVITMNDFTKMANQLNHSMGAYMQYFQYLCILISAILIYLITKIIVEKNEVSISMTKILGYTNSEISNLYLHSTTIVVLLGTLVSTLAGCQIMSILWELIMESYSGWFAFQMQAIDYFKIYVFIVIGYLLVLFFDYQRIRRIPMDEALKNVE